MLGLLSAGASPEPNPVKAIAQVRGLSGTNLAVFVMFLGFAGRIVARCDAGLQRQIRWYCAETRGQ